MHSATPRASGGEQIPIQRAVEAGEELRSVDRCRNGGEFGYEAGAPATGRSDGTGVMVVGDRDAAWPAPTSVTEANSIAATSVPLVK